MNNIVREDVESIVCAKLPWGQLGGATVAVTGAAGMLATYIVETLLALGDRAPGLRVIGMVRDLPRAQRRFAHHVSRKDLILIEQDLGRPLHVEHKLDFIVHAASQASPKFYGKDPVGTIAPNALGTAALLELALAHESKGFLFVSSGEVYGQVPPEKIPIREDGYGYLDPMNPRSCYAESKRMGEQLCVAYATQFGVNAKVVRPFHTYGPGMALDDGRVFADFVANVVANKDIEMTSDGSAIRPYCYISDATRAFFTALLLGEKALAYNVGNPDAELSVLDLATLVTGLFPERKLQVRRVAPKNSNDYVPSPILRNSPDISRLAALGFAPQVAPKDGFHRTIRSFE